MAAPRNSVPVEALRRWLSYDAADGLLRWRERPFRNSTRKPGDVAGCVEKRSGVVIVGIPDYRNVLAHRAIWALVYGAWPELLIDHRDGNPTNNRLSNLRQADHRINCENKRRPMKRSGTGFLGVTFAKKGKPFQAQIGVRGRHIYLGTFDTPEEAHAVYLTAKRQLHEGNTL